MPNFLFLQISDVCNNKNKGADSLFAVSRFLQIMTRNFTKNQKKKKIRKEYQNFSFGLDVCLI